MKKYDITNEEAKTLLIKYNSAIKHITRRHYKKLFIAEEVEAIVREALIEAHHTYDKQAGRNFMSWFYLVAEHAIGTAEKRNKYQTGNCISMFSSEYTHEFGGDSKKEAEFKIALNDLLDKLPPIYKQVTVDYYFGGYTLQEIVARLDIPLSTVERYRKRALVMLNKLANNVAIEEDEKSKKGYIKYNKVL
jgi:RNA polymerase sigma factor (sigma-70 family)